MRRTPMWCMLVAWLIGWELCYLTDMEVRWRKLPHPKVITMIKGWTHRRPINAPVAAQAHGEEPKP